MIVTLGQVIAAAKSNSILGIDDRDKVIDYINRGLELVSFRANWNPWLATIDICADKNGVVTLPYFVGTVLAVNIGGRPSMFRNAWYEFHVNGLGDRGACGGACGYYADDRMWSPTFQDIEQWSLLAAICEDPIDGNGSLELIVQGETMDAGYNLKQALTIPPTGPSTPGVRLKLLNGVAATDPGTTYFRKITQVTKPQTRGYVKLIAFPPVQLANAVTIGYYAPNELNPTYRRIKVSQACEWVRVRYRRATLALVNDYDIVPIASYNAMLELLKAIQLSDTGNVEDSEKYLARAARLLSEIQTIEDGGTFSPIQVEPGFGVGTLDWR